MGPLPSRGNDRAGKGTLLSVWTVIERGQRHRERKERESIQWDDKQGTGTCRHTPSRDRDLSPSPYTAKALRNMVPNYLTLARNLRSWWLRSIKSLYNAKKVIFNFINGWLPKTWNSPKYKLKTLTWYHKWKIPCLVSCDKFQSKHRHTYKKLYSYLQLRKVCRKYRWSSHVGLAFTLTICMKTKKMENLKSKTCLISIISDKGY